jgi:hypothetical protein
MTSVQFTSVKSAWRALPWRTIGVAALLAATVVCWAALPLPSGAAAIIALIAAVAGAVLSVAQLAFAGISASDPLGGLPDRLADYVLGAVNVLPWAEVMTVAAVVLEALHSARPPWHTGVLGVALVGYLLAVHLAETRAGPGVLRPQLGMLAAGIGVLALAVGAAALPAVSPGPAATAIRFIAVAAAIAAGGLIFPIWIGRRR